MKILIISKNLTNYIAKFHEAFRTGLAALYDVRFFGEGYDGHDPSLKTYQEIIKYACPDGDPDLIIAHHSFPKTDLPHLIYDGLADVKIKKAVMLGDYWEMFPVLDEYVNFIKQHGIDYIISYYPQPVHLWRESDIGSRMIYMPSCFDAHIFTDWKQKKEFDVGFLAAGTVTPDMVFYPERAEYHGRLLKMTDIRYFYAAHPGWGDFGDEAPLVGKGFSRAMNACKIFVTTGGVLRNAQPKVFEAMASRTMLLCGEMFGADELGFADGINYVKINPEHLEEQVRYYLANPNVMAEITERGYQFMLRNHSCYMRAAQFRTALYDKGFRDQ